MANLTEDIRKLIKKEKDENSSNDLLSSMTLVIEQTLNKLFYVTPNYKEELQMLKMQKMQEQKQGDRYGLHLSAIIASEKEFCYRQQVLSLFYKQAQGEQIPIGLKRIFKEGEAIGEKWQRMFISGGIGKKENMDISRFVEKYDLSYTPDAQITIAKKDWVVEIKSMNTFQFKHIKSHPSGRKQLRMYMYFEKKKHGFVLVEDKNTQEFKVFPEIWGITFGKEDIMPYIERLEAIQVYKQQFIEEKKVPKRHPLCTNSNCKKAKECSMRYACWNIGMGRVKLDVGH